MPSFASERPNILILYPDQLRADAMSCAGNPCIRTPHIDRLAFEGVRFTDAFVSFPLCSPFRASLFTGKYAHATGICANHYPIPLGQDFLAEIFRDNGYQTGYVGKWHLDGGIKFGFIPPGERRLGFETLVGFNRGHAYYDSIYYRDTDQPYTSRRYEPDYQTDHLIEFMDSAAGDADGRPFLAMICYGLPHPPLVGPRHYLELYSPDEVPVSDSVPQEADLSESRRRALARYHRTEGAAELDFREVSRVFLARYYGLVACVDHNIGKVLDWLDKRELADNTVVILASDHGEMAGEHGLFDKKTFYRSAMNSALIVRYPARFPGGRAVDALVDPSVDTMPTLLELCGLDISESVQGTSYLSLLDGGSTPTREAVYYEIPMEREGPERFPVPERGVRTKEWLYVRTREAPKVLFDLKSDPLEMNNLAGSDGHQQIVQQLDRQLTEHMIRTGDDWDIEAEFPPPNFQTHAEGGEWGKELRRRAILEP